MDTLFRWEYGAISVADPKGYQCAWARITCCLHSAMASQVHARWDVPVPHVSGSAHQSGEVIAGALPAQQAGRWCAEGPLYPDGEMNCHHHLMQPLIAGSMMPLVTHPASESLHSCTFGWAPIFNRS